MMANVDALNIIQIGLTLSDSNRNLPTFGSQNGYIWQFNFCDFVTRRDFHNCESIQLLKKKGRKRASITGGTRKRDPIMAIPKTYFKI